MAIRKEQSAGQLSREELEDQDAEQYAPITQGNVAPPA